MPCFDPDCVDAAGRASIAEPEQDGDHHFYACQECGSTFGFRRLSTETVALNAGDTCAVGIPEDVRRRASAGMDAALADQTRQQPPLLTIGRRSDAPAS